MRIEEIINVMQSSKYGLTSWQIVEMFDPSLTGKEKDYQRHKAVTKLSELKRQGYVMISNDDPKLYFLTKDGRALKCRVN